jgi:hypothetical protein
MEVLRNAYAILVGKPEGRRPLGRPGLKWEVILEWQRRWEGCRLGSSDSGRGQAAGCCQHGNETLDSIKDGEFLDKMSQCQLLKQGSAPCSLL